MQILECDMLQQSLHEHLVDCSDEHKDYWSKGHSLLKNAALASMVTKRDGTRVNFGRLLAFSLKSMSRLDIVE